MAGNVVRATLLADAKGFQRGFKEAEQSSDRLARKSSSVAGIIKGAFATAAVAAVAAFAKDSIRAFSQVEQATGAVESVFGDAGDSIESYSKRAATAVGLSESAFKQLAATVGGQLQNMGFSVDEASTKTIELIETGADMAATYGGTVSDAVSAISSLLRGERDPIEKYAVSIKDADVQARSLALGLDTTTTEAKKNADAVAALSILNDQTAKTTGQFARESDTLAGKQERLNAQIENTKALLGRALAPAMGGALDLTGKLTTAVADLALGLLVTQGEITKAEKALLQYEAATGEAVDSTYEFLDALIQEGLHLERIAGGKGGFLDAAASADDFKDSTLDLLNTIDPGIDTAREWRTTIEAVGRELGLEKEQIAAAKEAYDAYIVAEAGAARGAAQHKRATEEQTGAVDELEGEVDAATTALREQFDLIDGRLDTFGNLTEATKEQAEKQARVNKLVKAGKQDTPEYIEAIADLANANRDVRDAQIAMIEQGGLTRAEFVKQQTELGLTLADAQRLADEYDELFTPREVTHQIRIHEIRDSSSGNSSGRTYGGGRQHGGRVLGGDSYTVGEAGPETFVPDTSGRILPAGAMGATLNITINAGLGSDPNAIARAIVELLQRYERGNGPLPLGRSRRP